MIAELDGYGFHRGPTAFAADRERDAALTTSGWRVVRFTYDHVTTRPAWVAGAVSALLRGR